MKRGSLRNFTPLLGIFAFTSAPVHAALVLDFANTSGTFNGSVGTTAKLTVNSLTNGSPTDSDPQGMDDRLSVSGTLSGVSNTDSFGFFYDTFSTSSLAGNVLTLGGVSASLMASNSTTGVASADGDINAGGRGIYFEFDLGSLPSNTGLRITDFTATSTGGSGHDAQIVVDGVSVTNMGGLTGSGLSIDITDSDFVAFRNAGTGGTGDRFRVTEITLETFTIQSSVIPEPSSMTLLGMALGGLLLRRRR